MAESRFSEIHETHDSYTRVNKQVEAENRSAMKLLFDLEREGKVLEERKTVSC